MNSNGTPPAVLLGAQPAEGYRTLARLGVPFVWLVDPTDDLPSWTEGVVEVIPVPFKNDPLSVLRVPLPNPVCTVFSFTEPGLLPAALLAETLNLPTVPVNTVARTRSKLLMRKALTGMVPQPAYGVVGRDTPRPEDCPLIAKPVDGAGSMGVEYLADLDAYEKRAPELAGHLWEQYLDGPEYSVEAVSFGGRHQILGVTEKETTDQPYFVETGQRVPAALCPAVVAAMHRCVIRCLDGLGVALGASHTELKLTEGRPKLIETHTRAGGDRIPLLTKLVSGLDQYELAIKSVLPWVSADATPARYRYAAVHYFPWQGMSIGSVAGIDEGRAVEGVEELEVTVLDGGDVPVWRFSGERPGHVVIGADSPEDLRQRLATVQRLVVPDIRRHGAALPAGSGPVVDVDGEHGQHPGGSAGGRAGGHQEGGRKGAGSQHGDGGPVI